VPEIIHMAECGFCAHVDQRGKAAGPDGATEINGTGGPRQHRRRTGSTTGGANPAPPGLRQVHENRSAQARGEGRAIVQVPGNPEGR